MPVWGTGPASPVGVLVGEGPGPDEKEAGVPFIGPTGKQLDRELLSVGLDRSTLFVVNACLCAPEEGKTLRKMKTAVQCCKPAFEAQIRHMRQLPAFTMGSWAALAWLGVPVSLTKGRGFIR